VTSRQYGKCAIFVSGDVRFQDGDAIDLGKLGGLLSTSSLFILSMSELGLGYVVIIYTYRTTVLLWCGGLCDIRVLFMYNACQLDSTMLVSVHRFLYQIYQASCGVRAY
jgi:hypothetical protein